MIDGAVWKINSRQYEVQLGRSSPDSQSPYPGMRRQYATCPFPMRLLDSGLVEAIHKLRSSQIEEEEDDDDGAAVALL